MAARAGNSNRLVAPSSVIFWTLCAASLAAQSSEMSRAEAAGIGEPAGLSLASQSVPTAADAVITDMARVAGVIFAGWVTAIRRPAGAARPNENAAEGFVEVDFRVEEAVRGPASNSTFTLREWSGLWSASGGNERYRIGQHLLVFLYEPDIYGLSSPVHGRDGAVPLRGSGIAPGPDSTTIAAGEWMVDLRWVQAEAVKAVSLELSPLARPKYPREGHGFLPDWDIGRPGSKLNRDFVLSFPATASQSTPAIETQPLSQMVLLCQRTMRPGNGPK